MGALITTLLFAYTIAKVQRDTMFLAEFGALALPYAYIGVALASAAFVWLEGRVARRFTRIGAARLNQYAAIGFAVLAAAAYPVSPRLTAAFFYLWAGSQAMMLLPHFWVLALDVWDSRRARRLFPVLTGCGLIGGTLGGAFAGWLPPVVQRFGLLWTLSALLFLAHLLMRSVERHRISRPTPADVASSGGSRWQIVRKSTYIRYLAIALALSVIVATLVDFQFKFFIQDVYPDPHAMAAFLGKFYFVLNGLALLLQFGAAGWLLTRLGLGASTGLQPVTIILFSCWVAVSSGWWAVVAMRWIQGIVLQTLGKSSAEIYYMAIRPPERRRIKPAIDTLVERWSDAVVGLLLIGVLHAAGIAPFVIALITAVVAGVWLGVLFQLNRQYGRAFEQAMNSRWIEPEGAAESIRLPAARKALLDALRSGEERRVVLALHLCIQARHPEIALAVRECLRHASPVVRAAAVQTMEAMRLRDRAGVIEPFLAEPHEGLRRAAVSYLLAMSAQPTVFARRLLEGEDSTLRQIILDILLDRPHEAPNAVTMDWIDARLRSGSQEELIQAARALGAVPGNMPMRRRLKALLSHPDPEVRRAALVSATRRPSRQLLDAILPMLTVPELSYEARLAIGAIGDPAVPDLERLLASRRGTRTQALAARALAQIASPRAVRALMRLVRSSDLTLRHLGLQNASRARAQSGLPVLPQHTAHKLFLRELGEYRAWLRPAESLKDHPATEVRLLAESSREFADMALERGFRALACWYEPGPLSGAFERIRWKNSGASAPALEYLGHVLPRKVFRPVSRIFEEEAAEEGGAAPAPGDPVVAAITAAWQSGDAWLRACAVRASRHAPSFDPYLFVTGDVDAPIVREELQALLTGGGRLPVIPSPSPATAAAPA